MNVLKSTFPIAFLLAMVFPARAQNPPPPPEDVPVYVIAYMEVAPATTKEATGALKRYRDGSQAEPANKGLDIYQETGQSNRFMIMETWAGQANLTTHLSGRAEKDLVAALKPLQLSPPDVRLHRGFSLGLPGAAPGKDAVYVMTHLDVAPPAFAGLQNPLKAFVENTRKEKDLIRFDVFQHADQRRNHLTVLEAWTSMRAFDAHRTAAPTRQFREELLPMLGALYDQRIYKSLD